MVQVDATTIEVSRAEVDRVLSDLNKIAVNARIIPSFRDGQPVGFKIFEIKAGGLWEQLGFKNDDVVEKVNGFEIDSPDKALRDVSDPQGRYRGEGRAETGPMMRSP